MVSFTLGPTKTWVSISWSPPGRVLNILQPHGRILDVRPEHQGPGSLSGFLHAAASHSGLEQCVSVWQESICIGFNAFNSTFNAEYDTYTSTHINTNTHSACSLGGPISSPQWHSRHSSAVAHSWQKEKSCLHKEYLLAPLPWNPLKWRKII